MKKTPGKEMAVLKQQLNEAWSWGKKPKAPESVPPAPEPYTPPPPPPDKYEVITLTPKESEKYLSEFHSNKVPKKGQPKYYYPYAKALCEGQMDLRKVQPNIKLLCKHLREWCDELEDENWHDECGFISCLAEYYEKGKIKLMRYHFEDKKRKLDFATWYLNGQGNYNYNDED
jgi:hypothetical protein